MPRPTSKTELIEAAQKGHDAIGAFIDALSPERLEKEFVFEDRDRCVRDVLMHLVAWHRMMERWYVDGMAGKKPAIPSPGYTFKDTPALNQMIWDDAQQTPLFEARQQFDTTYQTMKGLIEAHSDEELFTKKHYKWTGSTSLGSYLVSATSSHYDWALLKLKKAKKTW